MFAFKKLDLIKLAKKLKSITRPSHELKKIERRKTKSTCNPLLQVAKTNVKNFNLWLENTSFIDKEAIIRRCFYKKLFLKISQNFH